MEQFNKAISLDDQVNRVVMRLKFFLMGIGSDGAPGRLSIRCSLSDMQKYISGYGVSIKNGRKDKIFKF